ncbi:MAG: hypothetical protein AB1411_03955 [Nitrospirota bacterium]
MKDPVPTAGLPLAAVIALLIVGIFILDMFVPVGVLVPVLYTVPLLLTLLTPGRRYFLPVAVAATILTVVGLYVSEPGGGPYWMAVANRAMAVLAIGVAAVFSMLHERVRGRLLALESLLPLCSSCKKVRDDRGYWKQLELYLEEHSGTQFSRGLCPDCLSRPG